MKHRIRYLEFVVVVVTSLCLTGCGGSSGGSDNEPMVRSGSWYTTGFEWPHDGEPLEADRFVIYSDAASEGAKQELALLAEDILTEIESQLELEDDDIYLYPLGQNRIHIYAYKNRFPQTWGGWGYYGGLLIFSLDHPQRQSFGHTEPELYDPTLKHELVHVVESFLKGDDDPNLVDVWFTEGLAEAMAGGTAGGSITDLDAFNELVKLYGRLNPIPMRSYDYPDINLVGYYYYYPMFQLAVEYLVDANGHGRSLSDCKDIFLDVRNGISFPAAFRDRMGMSLSEYKTEFFDLMNDYLP